MLTYKKQKIQRLHPYFARIATTLPSIVVKQIHNRINEVATFSPSSLFPPNWQGWEKIRLHIDSVLAGTNWDLPPFDQFEKRVAALSAQVFGSVVKQYLMQNGQWVMEKDFKTTYRRIQCTRC